MIRSACSAFIMGRLGSAGRVCVLLIVAFPAAAATLDDDLSAGRWDEAVARLRAEANVDAPTAERAAASAQLGHLLYPLGELAEARQALRLAEPFARTPEERLRIESQLAHTVNINTANRIYPRSYEAQDLFDKASEALDRGRVDDALNAYLDVTAQYPNVLVEQADGRYTGAAARVREILNRLPESAALNFRNLAARREAGAVPVTPEAWRERLVRYPLASLEAESWDGLGAALLDYGRNAHAAGVGRRAGAAAAAWREAALGALAAQHDGRAVETPPEVADAARFTPLPRSYPWREDLLLDAARQQAFEPVCVAPELGMAYLSDGRTLAGVSLTDSAWRFSVEFEHSLPTRSRAAYKIGRQHYHRTPAPAECAAGDGVVVWRAEADHGTSEILALDALTGGRLWTASGVPGLEDLRLVSGPVMADGVVWIAGIEAARLSQYTLAAVEARTGTLIWRTFIFSGSGTTYGVGFGELDSGFGAPALAVDDERVYYGSHMGCVAAVDRELGRLEWVTAYNHLLRVGPQREHVLPFLQRHAQPPLVAGETVIVAPRDANQVLFLSRSNGAVLARRETFSLIALLGADSAAVYVQLAGNRIAAWPMGPGDALWECTLDAPIEGAGILRGGWIQVRSGEALVRINTKGGGIEATAPLPEALASWRAALSHREQLTVKTSVPTADPSPLALQRITDRDYGLVRRSGGALLLEGEIFLECREPKPPYALRWTTVLPAKTRALEISGETAVWMSAHEIRGWSLADGELRWTLPLESLVEGAPARTPMGRLAVNGNTALVAGRSFAALVDAGSGRVLQTRHYSSPDEVRDIHFHDSATLLVYGGEAAFPRLETLTRDAGVTASMPLVYPEGLTRPAEFNAAALAARPMHDPWMEDNNRYLAVAPLPLRLGWRERGPVVLCAEALAEWDNAAGTVRWSPIRSPVTPGASLQVMAKSCVIEDRADQDRRRVVSVSHDGVADHEYGTPYTVGDDRVYMVEWSRHTRLNAIDLEWDEPVWAGPIYPPGDVIHNLVRSGEHLVLSMSNRLYGGSWLALVDPETGVERARLAVPLDEAPRLVPLDGGVWLARGSVGAWCAFDAGAPLDNAAAPLPGDTPALAARERRELLAAVNLDATLDALEGSGIRVDGLLDDWPAAGEVAVMTPERHGMPPSNTGSAALPLIPGPGDLGAQWRALTDGDWLWLAIQVEDDVHHDAGPLTGNDAVTLAFRNPLTVMRGNTAPVLRFTAGLVRGTPQIRFPAGFLPVSANPWDALPLELAGEAPAHGAIDAVSGGAASGMPALEMMIRRDASTDTTTYEFGLDMRWLGQRIIDNATPMAHLDFRLAITDNDGEGVRNGLEWTAHRDEAEYIGWGRIRLPESVLQPADRTRESRSNP